MAFLLLLLPLFSFVLLYFFAHHMRRKGERLATALMGIDFLLALALFVVIKKEAPINGVAASYPTLVNWFSLQAGDHNINFTFSLLIDELSATMLVIVTLISFLVHLYSIEYMKGKRNYERYFAYLAIFTFSMLGIVVSDNLLITFMFWELVGFSSYLLIGFWFDKDAALKASKKAFLFNRIGDVGFLIAIFIFYNAYKTLELSQIKHLFLTTPSAISATWLSIAALGLFAACAGKSAQFPLQVWLPDAMEGPTPVSALIHAATMVAAGVYLLAKVYLLLPADIKTVIAFTGAITAFVGALPALAQNDIKKVLAYSTISQLGYMVMGIGLYGYEASFFHLTTHAFFKAGLFLSAGAVIHTMHGIKHDMFLNGNYTRFDSQDMRLMGGFRKKMPVAFAAFVICAASLIGIPFFSGFLSKEILLGNAADWALEKYSASGQWAYFMVPLLAYGTVFITSIYMCRQVFMVFFGKFRLAKDDKEVQVIFDETKEAHWMINVPLAFLALSSLWLGFCLHPLNGYDSWLYLSFNPVPVHSHIDPLPLILVFLGMAVFFVFRKRMTVEGKGFFFRVLSNNWYLDKFYHRVLIMNGFRIAFAFKKADKKVIDPFIHYVAVAHVVFAHLLSWTDRVLVDGTVHLSAYLAGRTGKFTKSFQGGRVQNYFLIAVIAMVLLVVWVVKK